MNPIPDARPPALPPRPRMGSGVLSQRGPPPPVQPRRSSLLPNHHNSANSSNELTIDNIVQHKVPNVGSLGTDNISQNVAPYDRSLRTDENSNPPSNEAVTTLKCDTKICEDNLTTPKPPRLEASQEPDGKIKVTNLIRGRP
jgi:hypothetical protein